MSVFNHGTQSKWCIYNDPYSVYTCRLLEVHAANRRPNPGSVSVILQCIKSKMMTDKAGQSEVRRGDGCVGMDRDRNKQTQWAWNHMSLSILVCQSCFRLKWETVFKCSCSYLSTVTPRNGERIRKIYITHRQTVLCCAAIYVFYCWWFRALKITHCCQINAL